MRLTPKQFKCVVIRECAPYPVVLDQPDAVRDYWAQCICSAPDWDGERESMFAIALNTRRRVIGHFKVGDGTLDTLLCHAREVFRFAIMANASAVVLVHNHPSGDPMPSEADVKVTRDLIRAGQLLKIEVLDHLVCVRDCDRPAELSKAYASLRELGYFYS